MGETGDMAQEPTAVKSLYAPDTHGIPPYAEPGPRVPAPLGPRPEPAPKNGGSPSLAPQAPPEPATATAGRRAGPRHGRLLAGALIIALASGALGGGAAAYAERHGLHRVRLHRAPVDAGVAVTAPGSVGDVAERALPGVVTLHVSGGRRQTTGTGFVLDERGHILTSSHVLAPARAEDGGISVTFSGGEVVPAGIVGRDSGYDLAVIEVSGVSGLEPLALGDSDAVRVGDPVVAIGAPFDLANTVTSGIVSARERPVVAGGGPDDGSDVGYVDAIRTDAPVNPGNSGGPLMDARARVIGINSAMRAAGSATGANAGQGGSVGLGFAVPVNQGKRVAEELIATGEATHPVLGVTLDLDHAGDGARIATPRPGGPPAVTPGGPADRAGIRPRDVITRVDGVRVRTGEELIVRIRSHRPGERLTLTFRRGERGRTTAVMLGSARGG
ncbi:S1C family serine protease [Streptomyces meridianus]|uniref:Trypsin-like peptidase domain-containing protein n=1 Tax=Streptomyces meridianus TaxID=2938945 RepID=A0ABT0X1L9_9ACTN|nr:trypsin-like peptidase domain-containing protein [Streptomyces meridianus]MCM2576195.1 trypsin-like peptidase domain-containing protein [Streptomyces meridianus]